MRSSLRDNILALAAASILAWLELFRITLVRVIQGLEVGLSDLLRVVPLWGAIVIVSPWCAFMARRFPFRDHRVPRTLAAHFGGALVFVALHLVLLLSYHALRAGEHRGPGLHDWLHMYAFYAALDMSVYGVIVVVILLLDTRREAAERALATARLEQHLASARLENLQAQIRPHFLFNTLNTLAVLARKGDGPAVDRAIGDLGELLRVSFDTSGRHEIPLAEELEFLERYVSLQQLRFPDRLRVEWQISDEARRAMVPALLVQPLVENAIEHGLATTRGGHVRVRARRDREALEIEVEDSGPGFSGPGNRGNGVGLSNTRERLTLLYGERGVLSIGDRESRGGLVRIRLPWRIDGETGESA